MWSVLVAVLGSVYLAGKMSAEKGASQEATSKREEWNRALNEWCAKITDEDLENRLELYIRDNLFEASQKAKYLCNCIPKDQDNITTYLRILLAEHGKIKKTDAIFGIDTPLYTPKPAGAAEQKYKDFFEFVAWLNSSLNEHGADTGQVFFIPSYPKPESKKYYDMPEAGELLECGTYVWAPQRIAVYLDKK